jgi:hypothetical protein
MVSILSVFQHCLDANEFTVVEMIDLPGLDEMRSEIPASFREDRVGKWLFQTITFATACGFKTSSRDCCERDDLQPCRAP